jgi:hypothetical protein
LGKSKQSSTNIIQQEALRNAIQKAGPGGFIDEEPPIQGYQ